MIEGSLEDEVPGAAAELPEAVNAIQSAEESEEGLSGSSIEDEDYSSSASLEGSGNPWIGECLGQQDCVQKWFPHVLPFMTLMLQR